MGCSVVGVVMAELLRCELEDSERGDSGLMSPYAITRARSCK